jgi:hypothetical protein
MNKEYVLAAPYTHLHLALLSAPPIVPFKIFPAENIFCTVSVKKKVDQIFVVLNQCQNMLHFQCLNDFTGEMKTSKIVPYSKNSGKLRPSLYWTITFQRSSFRVMRPNLAPMETMPYTHKINI